MSHILHMSDLHYGKNITIEEERLNSLASWINDSNISIKYVVFTGDMIDALAVQEECLRKIKKDYPDFSIILKGVDENTDLISCIRAAGPRYVKIYDEQLRNITIHHMKNAGDLFKKFLTQINVDSRQVVLCCGNHDRMRFARFDDSAKCHDNSIDENAIAASFEAFNILCGIINNHISYHTMLYEYDGMKFVIANSNWKLPKSQETNNMCINCKKLSELFTDLKNSDTFNRNCNLFIAHKPYDDFCETTKYPYAGELLTINQVIERTSSAFLYGDKHSYSVKVNNKLQEYMCGLPISYSGVRYNLLDFDTTNGIKSCSYIMNDGRGWIEIPISDCMESIYNTSRYYLKGYALNLLSQNPNIPKEWDDAIELVQEAHRTGILTKMSQMFSSFSTLNRDRHSIEINNDEFFSDFISTIENCTKSQAIGIKGKPGLGKSTFLTTAYLYMLWQFSCGKTRFIPFYFNMEIIIDSFDKFTNDLNYFMGVCVNQFFKYLKSCSDIREKYMLPICIFIDGMEKSKLLLPSDNTVENQIFQIAETVLDKQNDRYVMCFNTYDKYHFDNSFENINLFEYVLFFNRIRIISYKQIEKKQDMFLTAYMSLKGNDICNEQLCAIKNKLNKFHRSSIDLSFLHHFDQYIYEIDDNETVWDVLKTYIDLLSRETNSMFGLQTEVVRHAAKLLFLYQKHYTDIIKSEGCSDLKITDFLMLCNSQDIMNYLVAQNYVQELIKYSTVAEPIPDDSILHSFMPSDLSLMIRLLIDEKGELATTRLARFIDLHSKELSGYLYSTLVYLCGHLRTEDNSSLVNKIPEPDKYSEEFFALCCRRSYDMAIAVCSQDKCLTEKIILELMDNENYRKFNRSYQIHYYQDMSISSIINKLSWNYNKSPYIGFDYRFSFLMLISKLKPALSESKPYPLMELDLFTICDLTYSRLQYITPNAFFYSAKYNEKDDSECQSVLTTICYLLDLYNKHYGGKQSTNERIGSYFSFMHVELKSILKKVSVNRGKNVNIPYVDSSFEFAKILKLNSLIRVGWNIDIPGTIKEVDQPIPSITDGNEESSNAKETLMSHVMESVYIAQLFLPEKLPEPGYQKSKVISLLLFSDLGRVFSNDYSPHYSNYRHFEEKERIGLAHMLTLGSLDGYATQPMYFELIRGRSSSDINIRICREIKMIQTEYKYYTLYHQLNFNDERRADFENDFEEPTTNICRLIRERLVLKNPDFQDFFKN